MSYLDDVIQSLLAGDHSVDFSTVSLQVQRRALVYLQSADVRIRHSGLVLASVLNPAAAVALAQSCVQDPELHMRRATLDLAIAARDQGLNLIRSFAEDPDEALATEAMAFLEMAQDSSSLALARRLTEDPRPPIRVGAVRLVGLLGHGSVVVTLRRMSQEEDPAVLAAITEAEGRISGAVPRPEPMLWWGPDEGPIALPRPQPLPDEVIARAVTVPDPEPIIPSWAPASSASSGERAQASGAPTLPDMRAERTASLLNSAAPSHELAPASEPQQLAAPDGLIPSGAGKETVRESIWEAAQHAALPNQLPSEARPLLRLLGLVAPTDQPSVLSALQALDAADLYATLNQPTLDRDAATAAGACIAARLLGLTGQLGSVRARLTHEHPGTRAQAALAVGALAGPSLFPSLRELLADPDAGVRAACFSGLADLGRRSERLDFAARELGNHGVDPAPAAEQARQAALTSLQS